MTDPRRDGLRTRPCGECGGFGLQHRWDCSKASTSILGRTGQLGRTSRLKRSPIRKVSTHKAAENRLYATWREQVMRERRECEAFSRAGFHMYAVRLPTCDGSVDELHHLKLRSQGGALMDRDNVVRLCTIHHRWAHDHPAEAKAIGLLKGAWDD